MRVAFAGTPAFAATALQAIAEAGWPPVLVLTQPDRPAGRGLRPQPSPVKQLALAHGWALAQPRGLRLDGRYPEDAAAAQAALQAARADVLVVAAYGLILPPWVLALPRLGCLNIHASLLPRWRGAAPIQRAIEAGDAETGITIMQMDEGLDTGPIALAAPLPIGPEDSAGMLHDRLAALGARLIVQALAQAERGPLPARPQPTEGVTYAAKIDKAEARLDFTQPAAVLARRVRAFDPVPGAWAWLEGAPLKVWRAHAAPSPQGAVEAPGTVLAAGPGGVHVATGDGVLVLTELQRAGGRRLPVDAFLRGVPLRPGLALTAPA
ncbi:methionyl-tRNA formyltransferase [Tepidimonas sediminis]|uniref:methionyl-tRNA formyltransferase n=1 Tax=Tepidimonas sediminis TaxID=2588941 RepID=UPI00117E63C2|nr:methionyl-tRNA formyltransferase [Tepidimonas sediminis]